MKIILRFAGPLLLFAAISNAFATTHYVDLNSTNPTPPYGDWSTAATNIQDAIDAATNGDLILVTNGIYATGGETVNGFALTNRVAINQPVTVQSVNGPSVTTIAGYQAPGTTNGAAAVRCVYLTNGAALAGFTLSGGATLAGGDATAEQSGGGIWCEGTGALISNCTISNNAATNAGGGVYSGTLSNCTITGNWCLGNGGGLSSSVMINCTISGNFADSNGGGADSCTASNCQFTGNITSPMNEGGGGGANGCTLWQCTIIGNIGYGGGGARSSTLDQCLIEGNSVSLPNCGGGGIENSTANNCTITNNYSEDVGGGVDYSYLTNCIVINNHADGDGGGYWCGFGPNVAQNCLFTGNTSGGGGGGANYAGLYNCTVVGNWAVQGGGGFSCSFYNCLVYYNDAGYQPNHSYCYFEYTCTTPMPIPTENGPGNFTSDPQLADTFHLSAGSPCVGAGTTAYVSGVDLEGDAWASPPSIGCDEFHPAAGPLNPSIQFDYTNVATGYPVSFTAQAGGNASSSVWDFGDGTRLTNEPFASHRWVASGDHPVTLTVSNATNPGGASGIIAVHIVTPPIHYVSLNSAGPIAPFSSWNTAATNIQDAIDAATVPGAVVLVSNGVYQTGGQVVYTVLTNRVAATLPVSLQSVNGAAVTTIQGNPVQGNSAVRCVWLTNGSSLRGFTITSGGTLSSGAEPVEIAAAGVWCNSSNVLVSDCTIVSNIANWDGAGMTGGTGSNCTFVGNSSGDWGGGAAGGAYQNCVFIGNISEGGGGVWASVAKDSYFVDNNTINEGGGAYESLLNGSSLQNNTPMAAGHCLVNNCTLVANTNGAVQTCVLNNSIAFFNTDANGAVDNYSADSIVNYSCTTPLPSSGAGNIASNPQLSFDSVHLSAGSPCIGAGNAAYATGVDIDGQPWANPPSIGCAEFSLSTAGPLTVSIQTSFTNIAPGYNNGYAAQIIGDASSIVWNFGDGTTVTNQSSLAHSWSALGDYVVTLTAYNDDNPGGVSASVTVDVVTGNFYVAQANSNPVSPYTSWATAATNIQDAVAVAPAGGSILVSNGVYQFGGSIADGTSNCVAAMVPLTIQSTGGPAVSVINGGSALRCVYLASGSVLSGFTLTNGTAGPVNGGGVDCAATTTVVSNCVIANNYAQAGGGAYSGTLDNCLLTGNVSNPNGSIYNAGGGAKYSTLNDCILTNNSADYGGGAAYGTLVNCLLVGNRSVNGTFYASGAGAANSTLINCTVVGNSGGGGGTFIGRETNCIIYGNSAGDVDGGSQVNCCIGGTPAPLDGSDNFHANPMLDSTWHLQSNSPCINAGVNSSVTTAVDLDGNPRIVGGTVDIGAYEYQAPTSVISYAWLQQYGLPTDGSVDHADLDGTTFNVYQDWIAGLNPTNALSVLTMLTPVPTNNPAGVLVTWQSVSNRTYYLQRATNLLAPPAFSSIQSNLAGQIGTTGYLDTTATNGGLYFYRVGVQ